MYSPNDFPKVKLEDGDLVNRIKNMTQGEWMKVCSSLGLYVAEDNGKGSHCAVYQSATCPPEDKRCCVVTLPRTIYPHLQRDVVKKLVNYGVSTGKFGEEEVWIALGIKKRKPTRPE